MITFLVTAAHPYTIQWYLDFWAGSTCDCSRILPYEELPASEALPGGSYIFTDLERLTDAQLALTSSTRTSQRRAPASAR